jgi:O-antigen/teichoic acid export membrane protein
LLYRFDYKNTLAIPNSKIKDNLIAFARNKFVHNVSIVAGGTALAQLIGIGFMPALTRIYSPEAFGFLGSFMALAGILSPSISLAYPIAIVLPKEDSEALKILDLALWISLLFCGFLIVTLIFLGNEILGLLKISQLNSIIFMLPVFLLASVIVQVQKYWLIRKHLFRITAQAQIFQSLFTNILKLLVGVVQASGSVLITLNLVGATTCGILMRRGIRKFHKTQKTKQKQEDGETKWIDLAKEHKDFPLYRCPQNFINSISQNLPILLLASFFGPSAAGLYTLGKRIVGMPVALIGESVGHVFYPKVTEIINKGKDPTRQIIKATVVMGLIGLPIFGTISLLGPQLFALAFGEEWRDGGEYARWLSFWLYFGFINRPSVAAIPALGLQAGLLIYEVFSTGSKVVALYLGFIWFRNDVVSIQLFSFVGCLAYISLIVWVVVKGRQLYIKGKLNSSG